MGTVLERERMARPKGRPKRSERDDIAVKIDRTLVGRAKLVATYRGVPVAELLSDMLVEPIDKAYAAMLRELEGKGGGGSK